MAEAQLHWQCNFEAQDFCSWLTWGRLRNSSGAAF